MTELNLFYSYSHKDEHFRNALETHLSLLARRGIISEWHDRKITAGTDWKKQIDSAINSADIILLLISSDFIASDYCYEKELETAMELHESNQAVVIPIILRPSDWSETPFARLQALPRDAKAISTWDNEDEAWLNVTEGLKKSITEAKNIKDRKQEKGEFHSINSLLQKEINALNEAFHTLFDGKKTVRGISTGFTYLDRYLDGLHPSELTVIAGRPEMGRSDLALQIAAHITTVENIPVAYFSFDLSADRLIRKLLVSEGKITSSSMVRGELDELDWPKLSSAVYKLKDAPLFIDDSISLTFEDIKDRVQNMISTKNIPLIVIDGIETLLFNEKEKNQNSTPKDITKKISLLAKSLKISILLTSNVDRQVEKRVNKRPLLQDLHSIGSLDDVADNVIFVYRNKIYDDSKENDDEIEVIITKNSMIPLNIGTFYLDFNPHYFKLEDILITDPSSRR